MVHFVGLDVSVKETSVCVVDDVGKVILEQKVPTEPAKTNEMRHLIAPSSMLEVAPTSIQSSSQKGMRTHRQSLSRSRRDTPSSPNRQQPLSLGLGNRSSCPKGDPPPQQA